MALVVAVALVLVVGVAGLAPHGDLLAPPHGAVGAHYLRAGVAETGVRNLVTATLLVYRGFDTFLEVVVLVTALLAVSALPGSAPSAAGPPGAGSPAVPLERGEAVPLSPVVGFVVRSLAPFIALYALASLYRGHVTPGGGFQSAAVLSALFIALVLVLGREQAERSLPRQTRRWLHALAPVTFAVVALLGWRLTGWYLGLPTEPSWLRESLLYALELAIAFGGVALLAELFLRLEG